MAFNKGGDRNVYHHDCSSNVASQMMILVQHQSVCSHNRGQVSV